MIDLCVRRTSIQSIQIKPKLTKKTICMELANLDTGELVIRFFNLKNGSDKAIEKDCELAKFYRLATGKDITKNEYSDCSRLFKRLNGVMVKAEIDEVKGENLSYIKAKKIEPLHPFYNNLRWTKAGLLVGKNLGKIWEKSGKNLGSESLQANENKSENSDFQYIVTEQQHSHVSCNILITNSVVATEPISPKPATMKELYDLGEIDDYFPDMVEEPKQRMYH